MAKTQTADNIRDLSASADFSYQHIKGPTGNEEKGVKPVDSDVFLTDPAKEVAMVAVPLLASGASTTPPNVLIHIETTIDDPDEIKAGTALWAIQGGANGVSSVNFKKPVTAVRARVMAGTWNIQVRQV